MPIDPAAAPAADPRGLLVLTLRAAYERGILIDGADGPIEVEIRPERDGRCKVLVRAPRAVGIRRMRREADPRPVTKAAP